MTQRAVNNAIVLYELGITSEELQTAREITEKVPALLNVLRSPLVTSEKKHHLIERVFDGSGLPRHLINFYKVMCNDGGIEELADIYAEWQKIWDTAHNRVQVECVFAETPSPKKENEIKAFLSRKYPGKELIYQISINLSWAVCASVSAMKNTIGHLQHVSVS